MQAEAQQQIAAPNTSNLGEAAENIAENSSDSAAAGPAEPGPQQATEQQHITPVDVVQLTAAREAAGHLPQLAVGPSSSTAAPAGPSASSLADFPDLEQPSDQSQSQPQVLGSDAASAPAPEQEAGWSQAGSRRRRAHRQSLRPGSAELGICVPGPATARAASDSRRAQHRLEVRAEPSGAAPLPRSQGAAHHQAAAEPASGHLAAGTWRHAASSAPLHRQQAQTPSEVGCWRPAAAS